MLDLPELEQLAAFAGRGVFRHDEVHIACPFAGQKAGRAVLKNSPEDKAGIKYYLSFPAVLIVFPGSVYRRIQCCI